MADKDETKTFTQEQLDEIIEKRLAREREKYADYDDLKKQVAALTADKAASDEAKKKAETEGKSETEKVNEQLASLTEQLEAEKVARQKSEADALRLRVAAAKGLNEAQARRLQGSTKEELEADADELLETFGGGKTTEKPETKGGFGRPKEALKAGASNEDDDSDVTPEKAKKIAGDILDSKFV